MSDAASHDPAGADTAVLGAWDDLRELVAGDSGLCTCQVYRADGTAALSVVNAGVIDHPVSGHPVVAFVVRGGSGKHRNLRRDARAGVLFRVRWDWMAAAGRTELAGPDDPLDGLEGGAVPGLLRDVFVGAGGTHDDWGTYDRVMAEERRTAVLMTVERFSSNAGTLRV